MISFIEWMKTIEEGGSDSMDKFRAKMGLGSRMATKKKKPAEDEPKQQEEEPKIGSNTIDKVRAKMGLGSRMGKK